MARAQPEPDSAGKGCVLLGLLCIIVVVLVVWGLISLLRTQQHIFEPDPQEILLTTTYDERLL